MPGKQCAKSDMMPEVIKHAERVAAEENGQYKMAVYEWDQKEAKPDVYGGEAPSVMRIQSEAVGEIAEEGGATVFTTKARVVQENSGSNADGSFVPSSTAGVTFIGPGAAAVRAKPKIIAVESQVRITDGVIDGPSGRQNFFKYFYF